MTATIYRALFLNEAQDADTESIGQHWSFDECIEDVVETSTLSLRERTGSTLILFRAQVSSKQINWDATVTSNREHSRECECVLGAGEEIEVEYRDDMGEWLPLGAANTGTHSHAWVLAAAQASQAEIAVLVCGLQEWASIKA